MLIDDTVIPCLYLPFQKANKLILYFHCNAEDVGHNQKLLTTFGQEMQMHVLAIEYPGYGIYNSSNPNADRIKQDALIVFDYLTSVCGVKSNDIIVFGRSIGTGPASYLCSMR